MFVLLSKGEEALVLSLRAPETRITAPSLRDRISTDVTVSFWESRVSSAVMSSSDYIGARVRKHKPVSLLKPHIFLPPPRIRKGLS